MRRNSPASLYTHVAFIFAVDEFLDFGWLFFLLTWMPFFKCHKSISTEDRLHSRWKEFSLFKYLKKEGSQTTSRHLHPSSVSVAELAGAVGHVQICWPVFLRLLCPTAADNLLHQRPTTNIKQTPSGKKNNNVATSAVSHVATLSNLWLTF